MLIDRELTSEDVKEINQIIKCKISITIMKRQESTWKESSN